MDSQVQNESKDMRATAERARREIEEAGSKLKSQAADAWEDVTNLIRKHPGQALGIALVTGVAAGILSAGLTRRRSSASDNFRDLAGSGSEAWSKIRSGFDDALCTMKDAIEDAVGKFK